MNKCDYCICKTCAIAQFNGGAEGCGNCLDCKTTQKPVNMCTDYYNPEKKKEAKMNLNFDKPAKIACNGKIYIKDGEVWVEFESKEDYLKFLKDTNTDPTNYDDDILKIKLSLTS